MSLAARMRAYFFAGILVTAPISITFYLAWLFIGSIDTFVLRFLPATYNPETYLRVWIPGLGLLIVVILLTVIGMFAAGIVGRMLGRIGESVVTRMPVIRGIYAATKQIFEAVLVNRHVGAYREVVLVEFPRKGVWTMGFVTGTVDQEVGRCLSQDVVSVFVPTTPNPTGGYLMFFPRADVIRLDLSVEDGIKMIVSTGIVTPSDRRVPSPPQKEQAAE